MHSDIMPKTETAFLFVPYMKLKNTQEENGTGKMIQEGFHL